MKQVIKFSAPWCMPCKALAPVFEKIKQDYKDTDIKFHFLDVENDPENLAEKFNVRSVPTVVFLKDNVEVKRMTGLHSKTDYLESINNLSTEC